MRTLLTRIFGIRGEFGDLVIDPKLPLEWFKKSGSLSINTSFAGKNLEFNFINSKDNRKSAMSKITLNNKVLAENINNTAFIIPRKTILCLPPDNNTIQITLS
jgi:cellobiose phosphorylase